MPSASRCPTSRLADAALSLSRGVADALVTVCLAPACAACGRPLDEPTRGAVCRGCWSAILPLTPPCCRSCGEPLRTWRAQHPEILEGESGAADRDDRCLRCRETEPGLALARAVGSYEGSLRDIVHALKYGARRSVARHLARRMRHAGAEVLSGADGVVPVPLHPARERARGFNQARELARHLGPPLRDVLARTRRTESQADLPAAKRPANVRGAFACPGAVNGLTLVLVDDVSTTGATLNACAEALLAAGAKEVRALTAAKAVAARP